MDLFYPIQWFANWLTYDVFSLDQKSIIGGAVNFFIYDSIKILLLLLTIIYLFAIIRTFLTPEKVKKFLSRKSYFGNIIAACIGIVTPFCSCSAVPLFIGFVEAGVPLGVTFSYLIAAPMINEIAVVLLLGLFGWQTALLYVSTGLVIAITAGFVIGRLKVEGLVEEWVYQIHSNNPGMEEAAPVFRDRIQSGYSAVSDIVGKVWPYLLVGIGVGAGIHGYVPENFMAGLMGKAAWWSVPVAVLIGVPLYSNAAGIIPVVQALLAKGASLGTALAFMMSVIGLSLPETIILRKVLKLPLIFIFVGVVAVGIIIVGYLFNLIY